METGTKMGMNKTGVQTSPIDIDRMLSDIRQSAKSAASDGAGIAAVRTSYITEAETVGTVPMPGTVKGAAKAAVKKLTGRRPEVLIDALGARLAFERSGVRLYDAVLTKYQATPEKLPGMSAEQLAHFRDEEAQHYKMLADCLQSLGADPTAQTPGADISGVESMGLVKVIEDPRANLQQTLHALLVIELADNGSWELLIKLAEELGQDKMAQDFRKALENENEHLMHVRQWHEQCVLGQAT